MTGEPEVSREDCEQIAAGVSDLFPTFERRLARTCLALYDREDELLRGIATRERKYQAAKAEAARMTEKFRAARAERDALTQEVERLRALTEGDPRTVYAEAADLRARLSTALGVIARLWVEDMMPSPDATDPAWIEVNGDWDIIRREPMSPAEVELLREVGDA